jgi:hypothetical protein
MQNNMASQVYKTKGNKGLYDEQFSIERLSEIGNPLEKIHTSFVVLVKPSFVKKFILLLSNQYFYLQWGYS